MSDFLNSIKITDKDKKYAISKILFTVINSTKIMSISEVLQNLREEKQYLEKKTKEEQYIEHKLNENEILAVYTLAKEVRISIETSSNKELLEYLELNIASVNEEKLLKFINETVKDIELTKKRTPQLEWRLQIGKIFKRLEGKNPCNEEENTKKNPHKKRGKIINIDEHLGK